VHPSDGQNNSKAMNEEDEDEDMEEDDDDTHDNLPILLSSQDMSALEHEGAMLGQSTTTSASTVGGGAAAIPSGSGSNGGVLGMDFHFGQPGLVPPGKTFITLFT
jgi:hypothetical protein